MKRKSVPYEIYRDALAGVKHHDAQLSKCLIAGQKVRLIWERKNPVDANAIRVESVDGFKLGYIKRGDTAKLHWFREREVKLTATISAVYWNNPSWESIYIKVTAPSTIYADKDCDIPFG